MTRGSNWRDTLFVWDGILETELEKKDPVKTVHWRGTWTGCESAVAKKIEAPKRGAFEEFVSSDMKFEVDGTAKPTEENKAADERKPFVASFTEGPGWDLKDEGDDEKKKHKDEIHDILLPSLRWTGDFAKQQIFAKGKNEYGPFISCGWMRPGNRLTIARRYLANEKDERYQWDLEQLSVKVKDAIFDGKTQQHRIPPWQCDIFNTDMSTKKRTAGDDEDQSPKKK